MKRNPAEYNKYKKSRCEVCGHDGSFHPLDVDHVLTYAAHRELANDPRVLMTVCRSCHTLKGWKGINFMADKFPQYKNWLLMNGYYKCELTGKWRLTNEVE